MNAQSNIVSAIVDISGIVFSWVLGNTNPAAILPLNFTDYSPIMPLFDNNQITFMAEDELSFAEKGLSGYVPLHIALDIIDPDMDRV